ncbi:hypothetical protein [Alphaproteobacteria bacterium endosymbiont of Tiliacea citrago]|uniref:hypothetical protein n=1 Tax=Alphaproteobacteria bacterium endosymbiont of Tiliacea citrago TaxID=3077944 RepID=UPI00313F3CB6
MNFINFYNQYYYLFVFILLFILSLQDFYSLEVDILTFTSAILLLLSNIQNYFSLFFSLTGMILIVFLSKFYYKKDLSSFADLILIVACSSQIKTSKLGFFLILISFFSLIYCLVFRKNKFPAIPFISIAFFSINIFKFFSNLELFLLF